MRNAKPAWSSTKACLCAAVLILLACAPIAAPASTFSIIYAMPNELAPVTDSFAADAKGNLYNTSGFYVFRLTPPASGAQDWGFQLLYTFTGGLVGAAASGGVTLTQEAIIGPTVGDGLYGRGTIYRLDHPVPLTATVLHAFGGKVGTSVDGRYPSGQLIPGPFGLLYGATASGGGIGSSGTVYAISPSATAPRYAVIHSFGKPGDGAIPDGAKLAVDSAGRLYGMTAGGGTDGVGTVYMLEHTNAGWRETVLYSFKTYPAHDLNSPGSNVVVDASGNVYGCVPGGKYGHGGLFELSPPQTAGSPWNYQIIENFGAKNDDPDAGACGLSIDPSTGRLFGASQYGGAYPANENIRYGTVFEADPPAPGSTTWTGKLIHSFTGTRKDGAHPYAPPLKVGDTWYGANADGYAYSFVPDP